MEKHGNTDSKLSYFILNFWVTKNNWVFLSKQATVKGLQIYSYIEDVIQKLMESRHTFCNPKAYCLLETILYYKTVLELSVQ